MREVRIVGSLIVDLYVSGFAGEIENLIVNDVDVTAFVESELDRRYPGPPTDYPAEDSAGLGLDIAARPTFAEVMDVRADRMALVRSILTDLTDTEFEAIRTGEPAPGWGEESLSMRRCLRVVLNEECEHHRYVVRDLATATARRCDG